MPKMKTHRGAAKRFTVTGTGKVMGGKSHQNHRRRKSPKALHQIGKQIPTAHADVPRVRQALGI